MLKTILSISGKPGLYKLISYGKNIVIVESLIDKKEHQLTLVTKSSRWVMLLSTLLVTISLLQKCSKQHTQNIQKA